jgi:hypothetical protein
MSLSALITNTFLSKADSFHSHLLSFVSMLKEFKQEQQMSQLLTSLQQYFANANEYLD